MSTIAEERARTPAPAKTDRWSLERLLAWRPVVTPEVLLFAGLFLVAFGLRFWDLAARAMHHDESLHATYSWYLYDGRGYEHHPLMHGPFLFHAMALVYLLFGVSDATARFVPAAFGAAMVLLPLLLRPWLGRIGTLAAAALIAVSPTLLYFSRFVGAGAQDIVLAVSMLMMAAGIWHYLRSGESRWIYLLAAGLALGFTTKEVTYMLAAILVVYLNGAAAADFAGQAAAERGWSPARRRLVTVALMPVAWALALFWPWLEGMRRRLRLAQMPRAGELLIVAGTLAAPMFAAGSQVALARAGIQMGDPSPFRDWTNERLWGALTIGGLLALSISFGTAWKPKEWLIAAAIFWGASLVLFTTFFTNPDGIASGIWGSLDYWLEQHDVRRGNQPVFYYLILTPVYEYVTLGLGLAGVLYAALRTGRDTALAALVALVACAGAAVFGDGAKLSLLCALVALCAAVYAMRGHPFRQFVVLWAGAIALGLSASGEKMPWLEVHIALPLALLAALAIDDAARAVRGLAPPAWARPVGTMAALGVLAAALALASDRFAWANPALVLLLVVGVAGVFVLAVLRRRAAGLAATAFVLAFAGPLSVRAAAVAAFEHGDTPVEMLVYTQSTPELKHVKEQIDQYARESGQGLDLPITVDATEAFTWPWAWYLRDYHRVSYPDLTGYQNNPSLLATLPRGGVLLTQLANAGVGLTAPDNYGPGQRYRHRWWFPEDGYRGTTASKFFGWLHDSAQIKMWGEFFLHRTLPAQLGSIDAVAYFPPGFEPGEAAGGAATAAPEPRLDTSGRLVAGAPGTGRGQLQRPAGIATDAEGNIYVADSLNNRVQKFGPDGFFAGVLSGPQQLREPWGVAVDRDGNVYVADTWNHRIQKYDRDLKFVQTWGRPPQQAGAANPDLLELYGPRAIAIDAAGNLWVTDTGHSRLVKYSPDGKPLGAFGGPGAGPGQFQEPVGLAIAPNGDILVADTWNGRVQRFDAAFGYKGEFKVGGWSGRGVENKPYIAVAPDGSVYLTEPDSGEVLRYGADGRLLGPAGPLGDEAGFPPRPLGVVVDPAGHVWVADGADGSLVRLGG